ELEAEGEGSGDLKVGVLTIKETKRPGLAPTLDLDVSFRLPDLPDGGYLLYACNAGCRDKLGDLTGAFLYLRATAPTASAAPPITTAAPTTGATVTTTAVPPPPTTVAPAPVTEQRGTEDGVAALVLATLVLLALAAVALLYRTHPWRSGRADASPVT